MTIWEYIDDNTGNIETVIGDYQTPAEVNDFAISEGKVIRGGLIPPTTSLILLSKDSMEVEDVENSALAEFDIYVDSTYSGSTSTGSALQPYTDLSVAISNSSLNNSISIKGVNVINAEIVLPHSLSFYGSQSCEIKYVNFDVSNSNIFYFEGNMTQKFIFKDITFKNAGGYALLLKKTNIVEIRSCKFFNNGWDGTQLHTVLSTTTSGVLGYDSTQAELQAFYASSNASNGGAIRIQECTKPLLRECRAENNLRGFRLQDCGINGGGFVIENQSISNIESGIYLASGSAGGCQNITVTINYSSYNANNGLLCIGGINNKFSQNEVNGNWNAGFCGWGSVNLTLRDCGLYDNNRSQYNGIGNTGDAKASIQINDAYNLLGTQITYNPAFRFIAEILDTQVHYTGLGSNTEKIGFLITSAVGDLADNEKNIIKIDDVGFIGQDYAIDFSEVDLTNLHVALGDNSFMSIGEKAVKQPSAGEYYELPFSNHVTRINYADFSVDLTGNIKILEGVGGMKLNPYKVNDLQAVADGTEIRVILKDSKKVQFNVPVSGCSIDGSYVNSVLNQAVIQLNNLFTNTVGFASGGGNPVTSFVLSGNNLTIGLQDSTSFTVDVTTLGVDENKFVSSGALNGSDLVLTMNDSTEVTIDASNMINGSSTFATGADWYISYGTYANQNVNSTTSHLDNSRTPPSIGGRAPFYFGTALTRGTEFRWNNNPNASHLLGIWDGTEAEAGTYNSRVPSNWSTAFNYHVNGFQASSNVSLTNTTATNKYTPSFGAPLALRFLSDGHITLSDLSGATEVEIAKTINPLVDTSFQLQLGCDANFVFPQFVVQDTNNIWTIVHDLDGDEGGILNGIQDHTVIKSNMSIEMGEKIMFHLDGLGQGDFFGTEYTNASSGVSNAEETMNNHFKYDTNEGLGFNIFNASDWNVNTNATYYFNNGAGFVGYRKGSNSGTSGTGLPQGMFSLRFNNDGKLTIFSEDNNEKVATAKIDPQIGSSVHLHYAVRANRTYSSIPVISKQTIGGGSQPIESYAPTVADQTATVVEGDVLNYTIIDSDNIVNQYVEVDAPSWMFMNQTTGVLSGTAPAFLGTAADTIVVNCKAGNAIGGTVDFTVTITVTEDTSYTNTKSLEFNGTTSYLSGNPLNMNAMDRATNGDGNAWTLSMWVKPSFSAATQTLFNYGKGSGANEGAITLYQSGGNNLLLQYGTTSNRIIVAALSCLTVGSWNHILVTFNGGTTGVASGSLSDYYSRFKIAVNGINQTTGGSHQNYGYNGVLNGNDTSDNIFRIGRDNNALNNYADCVINQVAIWSTDESANLATIYNSGATQDLSLLASAPDNYYEIDSSVTTITDEIGSANLTGYNFTSSDLVTDTP